MTPTLRKPLGMLAIIAMVTVWVVLAASLSGVVGAWHPLLQAGYYLVAGIAWIWVLPLRRMLVWMETGK